MGQLSYDDAFLCARHAIAGLHSKLAVLRPKLQQGSVPARRACAAYHASLASVHSMVVDSLVHVWTLHEQNGDQPSGQDARALLQALEDSTDDLDYDLDSPDGRGEHRSPHRTPPSSWLCLKAASDEGTTVGRARPAALIAAQADHVRSRRAAEMQAATIALQNFAQQNFDAGRLSGTACQLLVAITTSLRQLEQGVLFQARHGPAIQGGGLLPPPPRKAPAERARGVCLTDT